MDKYSEKQFLLMMLDEIELKEKEEIKVFEGGFEPGESPEEDLEKLLEELEKMEESYETK